MGGIPQSCASRDEGAHYAALLAAAGVTTRYRCAKGVLHGFRGAGRFVPAAREELEFVAVVPRHAATS